MDTPDTTSHIAELLSRLSPGSRALTPLELNDVKLADKATLITEDVLRRMRARRPAAATASKPSQAGS